ncbi:MAG TPA: hypothetical protein DD417_03420 [Elusimicrobia bacterium]|nr:hypothetical protein [Elusimicrobiota bacterium]
MRIGKPASFISSSVPIALRTAPGSRGHRAPQSGPVRISGWKDTPSRPSAAAQRTSPASSGRLCPAMIAFSPILGQPGSLLMASRARSAWACVPGVPRPRSWVRACVPSMDSCSLPRPAAQSLSGTSPSMSVPLDTSRVLAPRAAASARRGKSMGSSSDSPCPKARK